jgi:hypothetical protein
MQTWTSRDRIERFGIALKHDSSQPLWSDSRQQIWDFDFVICICFVAEIRTGRYPFGEFGEKSFPYSQIICYVGHFNDTRRTKMTAVREPGNTIYPRCFVPIQYNMVYMVTISVNSSQQLNGRYELARDL